MGLVSPENGSLTENEIPLGEEMHPGAPVQAAAWAASLAEKAVLEGLLADLV